MVDLAAGTVVSQCCLYFTRFRGIFLCNVVAGGQLCRELLRISWSACHTVVWFEVGAGAGAWHGQSLVWVVICDHLHLG